MLVTRRLIKGVWKLRARFKSDFASNKSVTSSASMSQKHHAFKELVFYIPGTTYNAGVDLWWFTYKRSAERS